jgi:hypothetical protein
MSGPSTIRKLKLPFPLLLIVAWTGFGLFFGTQNYVRDVYVGQGASLPGYLTSWLLCGYSWAILTVPVIKMGRRFSRERLGWSRFFAVHIPAAVFFALTQLAIYVLIASVLFGTRGRGIREFYKLIAVNEFQSSFLVYFVIISTLTAWDHWFDVPAAVSPVIEQNGHLAAAAVRRLSVKDNGRIVLIAPDDIDWIESYGNYVFIHTSDKRIIHRETMAAMERKLDPEEFIRIRRSAIIRVDQIAELRMGVNGEYEVSLRSGHVLAATRRYRKNLEKVIKS